MMGAAHPQLPLIGATSSSGRGGEGGGEGVGAGGQQWAGPKQRPGDGLHERESRRRQ